MSIFYYPEHINIETSDYCNRSCHYCPIQHARGNHPPQPLDMGLYEGLLLELQEAPHPLKISLQWIDEPLANPAFFEYAALGRKLLPDAMWLLQTNGDLLTTEKAAQIKPLFDAVAVNVYAESAHDAFLRKDLDLVTARYPHRIQSPGRLTRSRGFVGREDEAIFHVNEKYHGEEWVQSYDKIQQTARCMRLWMQVAIGYDGQVYACCRDNLKQHPIGDLRNDTLLESYNGPEAQRLRRLMERGERGDIDMCRQCPGAYPNQFFAYPAAKGIGLAPERLTQRQAPAAGDAEVWSDEALAQDLAERQMPFGLYDYETGRALARSLGHVALPGFFPGRYEYVVGLTRSLALTMLQALQQALGDALRGVWVCGSRVVTRTRLLAIDPSVFKSTEEADSRGTLRVGKKTHIREFGPDPRLSSDMDVKVLIDEDRIDEAEANRLGKALGLALEAMSPYTPLSGHTDPKLRLLRVPASCGDAREAFAYYNAMRMAWLGKGPLSLEYVQLIYDPAAPESGLFEDPTVAVTQRLQPVVFGQERASLASLQLPKGWQEADADAVAMRLRSRHDGLTLHQLIGSLRDFPALEPAGVVVERAAGGEELVSQGAGAVWAASQAGRSSIAVVRRQG